MFIYYSMNYDYKKMQMAKWKQQTIFKSQTRLFTFHLTQIAFSPVG